MKLIERFKRLTLANQANVIFGAIVTIATLGNVIAASVQYQTAKANAIESSGQTAKIIEAAYLNAGAAQKIAEASGRNATAAETFSLTAVHINQGVADAVGKLQAQADKMETARQTADRNSREALQTATQNSRSDLRAYLVTTLTRDEVVLFGCNDYPQSRPCVDIHYTNVGRTPAVGIDVIAFLHVDQMGGQEVGEQTMRDMVVGKYVGLQGGVLGSSALGTARAKLLEPWNMRPCTTAYHGAPCGHTVYGLIRYRDIFGESHETGFCTYFQDDPPLQGQSCRFGNWFDQRPNGYVQEH